MLLFRIQKMFSFLTEFTYEGTLLFGAKYPVKQNLHKILENF